MFQEPPPPLFQENSASKTKTTTEHLPAGAATFVYLTPALTYPKLCHSCNILRAMCFVTTLVTEVSAGRKVI